MSLVLFMVCLAILGSALATLHYAAVDLPQQNALQAPENAQPSNQGCETCKNNCKIWLIMGDETEYYNCIDQCGIRCST